ncbi:MAG: hypothetical protein PUC65_08100 [Clostridiales bacterium]|nr:hypothetical protein [Clostridiales bacterium]
MKLYGVEMLPTSLVACFINKREVRILEISEKGFSFRVPERLELIQSIQLHYLVFQESRYEKLLISDYQILEEMQEEFYYVYTIGCKQEDYQRYTSMIIRDYSEYVRLKLSGDDAYCSQAKVDYPAEEDLKFYGTYLEQEKDWLSKTGYQDETIKDVLDKFELAISIDHPSAYEQYLNMSLNDFIVEYFKSHHMESHELAKKQVNRIYVGNEFCHNLFPEKVQLMRMLEKTKKENLNVTLAFTYMRDEMLEQTQVLLKELYDWCKKNEIVLELVVNDWGMVQLLENMQKYFTLCLGILLNKRRKDPRYPYKSGYQEHVKQLAQNSLSSVEYRKFLEKWNIKRYEFESCGYLMEVSGAHNSIHFPFYQTNTSQYCTLYAKCTTMDRGKQQLVTKCPRYCEEFIFAYPKHLKMVGRYNSLFGFDDTLLNRLEMLQYYLEQGMDRLVLNL